MESEIIDLIKELRNGRDAERNWNLFDQLIKTHEDEILEAFSTRWLISIIDTYIDYAPPERAMRAMIISTLMNMLRFSETVKYVRPEIDQRRVEETSEGVVWLENGLNTFAIQRQDVLLNLSKRMHKTIEGDPLMYRFFCEFLRRVSTSENVVTDFSEVSAVKERYFPLEPEGIKDNYRL